MLIFITCPICGTKNSYSNLPRYDWKLDLFYIDRYLTQNRGCQCWRYSKKDYFGYLHCTVTTIFA